MKTFGQLLPIAALVVGCAQSGDAHQLPLSSLGDANQARLSDPGVVLRFRMMTDACRTRVTELLLGITDPKKIKKEDIITALDGLFGVEIDGKYLNEQWRKNIANLHSELQSGLQDECHGVEVTRSLRIVLGNPDSETLEEMSKALRKEFPELNRLNEE